MVSGPPLTLSKHKKQITRGDKTMAEQMRIIDSHTGGEPTRTIISGGPDLGQGSMAERREICSRDFDHIRTALANEPRGADVMVGAILCQPQDPANTAGVIFFNNAGFLGMCGHGTIGLMVTLYHLGQVALGIHRIETPVGVIEVNLHSPSKVTIENVPSYRYAKDVKVKIEGPQGSGPQGLGSQGLVEVTGDIAWGGNWFFLIKDHGQPLTLDNTDNLLEYCWQIKSALERHNITGHNGELIDHVELFGQPMDSAIADSQNFVLCPGRQYDRSPCGTGTSAKLACLYADGMLQPGQIWRQQSIIGSVFEGSVSIVGDDIIPTVSGEAFVTLDSQVFIHPDDPFGYGF
ncbi:MAG: 4-hydroxyproline epimerase [Phenylobacterium sp.]|jgi:4-hydroxyproline epimerase